MHNNMLSLLNTKELSPSHVCSGDIVLIRHKEKPIETGWWFATNSNPNFPNGYSGKQPDIFYLVNTLVGDAEFSPTLVNSKQICGVYSMMYNTLNYKYEDGESPKYEILAIARGLGAVLLSRNDFDFSKVRLAYGGMNIVQETNNRPKDKAGQSFVMSLFNINFEFFASERGLYFLDNFYKKEEPPVFPEIINTINIIRDLQSKFAENN